MSHNREGNMGKKNKRAEAADEQVEREEPAAEEKREAAEKVEREAEMVSMVLDVSVNGIPAGQKLTVEKGSKLYSFVEQGLAHVEDDR